VHRVYAIALNTYREAVRDRVLVGVLGFACAVLTFTLAIAELSLHHEERVLFDVGLATISLFSVLMAVFLGSSLLYKEIERKTLYVILPKPLGRGEFLVGKYFGIVLTSAVFVAIMGALELLLLGVERGGSFVRPGLVLGAVGALGLLATRFVRDRALLVLPVAAALLVGGVVAEQGTGVGVGPVLGQLALTLGEVSVLVAVALVFSAFSTPFLTGLFTIGVWLLGRAADDMATMRSKQLDEGLRGLLHGLAEVVPNFQLFVPARAVLLGDGELDLTAYVARALGYAACYSVLLLGGAVLVFRRRDFQ
jgi:Cu-processing system permease protein